MPSACCFLQSTYTHNAFHLVYTSLVSDLVLAKSVAVGKTPRQSLLFDRLLYWPHIAWAHCVGTLRGHVATIMKSSPHYVRIESMHHFRSVTYIGTRPSPDFSPRLRDKIWEWPRDEANCNPGLSRFSLTSTEQPACHLTMGCGYFARYVPITPQDAGLKDPRNII